MRTFLLLIGCSSGLALAADHAEAPLAAADPAADIADFYAWHTEAGTFVAVITIAPLTPAGGAATYDADVLYTVHIDQDGDLTPDVNVEARFGPNAAGDWGLQVKGIPSQAEPLSGPVETILEADGTRAWAGLRDDPFFFDLAGYNDTLATGSLAFDPTRDSLAGANVVAIVIETPTSNIASSGTLSTWATTARK